MESNKSCAVGRWSPAFLLLFAALPAGCTTVQVGEGGLRKTYVGVVSLNMPPATAGLTVVEAKNLGAGWDNGPFLGWKSASWITADPAKCQLLVVIRSTVEVANAIGILESLEGEDLCVADFTGSLQQ